MSSENLIRHDILECMTRRMVERQGRGGIRRQIQDNTDFKLNIKLQQRFEMASTYG